VSKNVLTNYTYYNVWFKDELEYYPFCVGFAKTLEEARALRDSAQAKNPNWRLHIAKETNEVLE